MNRIMIACVLLILCSCSQKVLLLTKPGKNELYQISLAGKKNGHYQMAAINYKLSADQAFHFFVFRNNCDSFFIHRFNKIIGGKKTNYRRYTIARQGTIAAEFSVEEKKQIAVMKDLIDSLKWCSSGLLTDNQNLFITELTRR